MWEKSVLRSMVRDIMSRDSYPDNWDSIRHEVYERDNYQCCNCGRSELELHAHHIVPLSKGGTNNKDNLITVCRGCHMAIHNHRPVAPTHPESEVLNL